MEVAGTLASTIAELCQGQVLELQRLYDVNRDEAAYFGSIAGKTAEDFTLNIAGKPTHLSDLRGKVVVLNFWASWCPPCVEETPALNHLEKYIASRNALVLGISIDDDHSAYERPGISDRGNLASQQRAVHRHCPRRGWDDWDRSRRSVRTELIWGQRALAPERPRPL